MIQPKSFVVKKAGSLKNLQLQDTTLAPLQAHEVSIAVKAIGLNYAEIFAIMGLYSATPKGSFIPGLEYAGEVIQAGASVTNVKTGDRIMGIINFGAYTTHLNIDARYVIPLPQGWSYEEGAAFLVQGLTAYYALVPLGNVQPGQTVLIHSAAGGVGLQANRIAKKLGAYTIGVVGSTAKLTKLQEEGYDGTVVRSDNFKAGVQKALNGRELNLVLESAGGKYFTWSYQLLAPQGRLITFGSAQFTPQGSRPNYARLIWQYLRRPKVDPMKMTRDNKSVMAFNLIWLYGKVELMHQIIKEIQDLHLPPPFVGHQFTFENLPHALTLFQSGKTMGKVVINVP